MARRFAGTHPHKVEARGRVSIPSDFRKVLRDLGSDAIYLVPQLLGPDAHVGFSEPAFDRYCEVFEAADHTPEEQQIFDNYVMGRAKLVEPDDMGRIVLGDELRSMIGIEKEIVFVGLGSHFEMRSPAGHAALTDGIASEGQRLAASVRMRGLV